MDNENTELNKLEARQADRHHMNFWVLGIAVTGIVVAFALLYFFTAFTGTGTAN